MSNLAYHPKGLKVKEGPFRPGTNHPSSDVTTSDFRQLPLEVTIVHPGRVRGGAGGATRHEVSHKGREKSLSQRRKDAKRCFERPGHGADGFTGYPRADRGRGRGQATGNRPESGWGRGGVRRWGGNAGVARGYCRRATGSAGGSTASPGSPGSVRAC